MFMWSGYTGPHFNVFCDLQPSSGRRLVYQTFPGGIHSGTDFYLNDAGLMIGETTVQQTPFDIAGTPQSSRIRKAAQYASSIDEAVRILTEKNNGLYTNDWPMADAKTNEIAIFLLGTKKWKLWRGAKGDFPGGTSDFYWSVNNAKDIEVRKEYIPDALNQPFDFLFSPSNRDVAMFNFFKQTRGRIDVQAAVNLMASSPVNRPHACDGKVTSGAMAKEMVFMAHFGKTTLREKFPGEHPRVPQLPDGVPHLTLGYSVFSPKLFASALAKPAPEAPAAARPAADFSGLASSLPYPQARLWSNTVFPATDAENWFVSASAAYQRLLRNLPEETAAAAGSLRDGLAAANSQLLFITGREGRRSALEGARAYDSFGFSAVPRIRGLFLLHQLRLYLGNDRFASFMKLLHERFREKPLANAMFSDLLQKGVGLPGLRGFVDQWLRRSDLPAPKVSARRVAPAAENGKWRVLLEIEQPAGSAYHFLTTVAVETAKKTHWRVVEVPAAGPVAALELGDKPLGLLFNAGADLAVENPRFYTYANFSDNYSDNFADTWIVYGTGRQIEANHTLALRYRAILADVFSEILPPVKKESELDEEELGRHNLIVLGGAADNGLAAAAAEKLGLSLGKNWFAWQGKVCGHEADGLVATYPNPWNPKKTLSLVIANSALQLWQMTKSYAPLPSWALYRGERIVERGYHMPEEFKIEFKD
jgi:hypothetical protein